jgi:hypothetical protein
MKPIAETKNSHQWRGKIGWSHDLVILEKRKEGGNLYQHGQEIWLDKKLY